ncbi:N-acetyl-gamma-glutamyl-phosphate reductase [Xanthomonas albilineans]|uniref:N-acetyl-gamma-glutamyl-phosphate reductase n=1 Tax=Xanthomonas albilineans (strain GPE PC73 / CFBP 7063) TaxID=380358 RepID=D2U8N1_XANAP|nr:N-acetyl-gamma-glutamyl-phosphate reductase [Xanthomonas albilineans]QHQ28608.1 putative n-acetyl-gamma-glutamyl phosphate reductase nad(p)-binding protein [Xanthomonas albilineans]CBA16379.1 probable n-acetyl-gamma-glutamyl phosphate reductase, nad(p)-binding protein [Xanthomonas albilineans GPE PC73]
MSTSVYSICIVGARGHTGAELIRLIAAHPQLCLAFVSSRELDGQRVDVHHDAYQGELRYENLDPEAVAAKRADVVVLALPNGKAAPYVAALEAAQQADATAVDPVIVDLSADYRFDPSWYYGLPELTRTRYAGQRRISNPGCYATAMQLAVAPLCEQLAGPPQCFGVSGYSGAGTTPSDKNDPALLRDNLMPYALTDHLHEREVSAQLGLPVEFMPHVAAHFRGITMTVNLWLQQPMTLDAVQRRYRERYAGEALIEVLDTAPWVSRIAGRHGVQIGGFTLAPGNKRLVLVATLDNLLKGAATQAMQNLNLALGLDELTSIPV